LWFSRRRRLQCQRDKSHLEAQLRARNAELGAANSQISALRGELGTRAQEIDALLYQLATQQPDVAVEPLAEMRKSFPKGAQPEQAEDAQPGIAAAIEAEPGPTIAETEERPQNPPDISQITDEQWAILRAAGITTEEELATVNAEDLERLFLAPEWQRVDGEILETEAPATANVATARADDLTLIAGVGPKYAAVLQEHGFPTFARLAASDPEELAKIFKTVAGRTPDIESWIEQAQAFQAGE
jgi:predicted flap endonuclease-1-like 5' DNA nuclease